MIIADIFSMLGRILICIIEGEVAIVEGISYMIEGCPGIFAVYIEISAVAMPFMFYMLMKRKEQRSIPVPPPQVMVSQVPLPECPPDTTLRNAVLAVVGIVFAVLVVFSASF